MDKKIRELKLNEIQAIIGGISYSASALKAPTATTVRSPSASTIAVSTWG
jgi:hypothetical protein